MVVLVYLRAVAQHWVATMSGIASLAIGTGIQWRWISPAAAGRPSVWWTVAGICFAIAMFQAWLDEHRARVVAEGRGPRLVLEFREDDDRRRQGHHWQITNTGSVDAVNVTSDNITVGDATVNIERIALLRPGRSEEVSFNQRIGANPIGHARHPQYLLDDHLKKEVAARYPGAEFVEHLADCRLPIRLSYFDPAGIEYESRATIRWNGVLDRAYVEPVSWGVVMPMPWWRRWFNRLRGRRALSSLIASIIIVVAVTSTAAAECAWVTWAHTLPGFTSTEDIPEKWEPLGAIEARADCEAARARLERFHRWEKETMRTPTTPTQFICLPDTVNPRAPKGK